MRHLIAHATDLLSKELHCRCLCASVWRVNLWLNGSVSWYFCVTMATTADKDQGKRVIRRATGAAQFFFIFVTTSY